MFAAIHTRKVASQEPASAPQLGASCQRSHRARGTVAPDIRPGDTGDGSRSQVIADARMFAKSASSFVGMRCTSPRSRRSRVRWGDYARARLTRAQPAARSAGRSRVRRDGRARLLIQPLARPSPVLGRGLEVAISRPVRNDADDVGEVSLGVELVQLARSDEGEEVRGGLGVAIGAAEHPGFAADRDDAERAFGCVIFEAEPTVIEETAKRVARGGWRSRTQWRRDRARRARARTRPAAQAKKSSSMGREGRADDARAAVFGRDRASPLRARRARAREGALRERAACLRSDRSFPEFSARMRPTGYFVRRLVGLVDPRASPRKSASYTQCASACT